MPPESVFTCASRHLVRSTASSSSRYCARAGARHAVELGVDAQVFFDGQVDVAGQRLRDDADHAAGRVGVLADVVSGDEAPCRW
jgi:hypothetical protein